MRKMSKRAIRLSQKPKAVKFYPNKTALSDEKVRHFKKPLVVDVQKQIHKNHTTVIEKRLIGEYTAGEVRTKKGDLIHGERTVQLFDTQVRHFTHPVKKIEEKK